MLFLIYIDLQRIMMQTNIVAVIQSGSRKEKKHQIHLMLFLYPQFLLSVIVW